MWIIWVIQRALTIVVGAGCIHKNYAAGLAKGPSSMGRLRDPSLDGTKALSLLMPIGSSQ